MNNSLDLFVSVFWEKKGCMFHSYNSRMFLSTAWIHGWKCSQKTVGSFTKRQKNFHYVLDRLGRGRHGRGYLSHLSCHNGKRCLQRYGWCDMAEEMVAIEDNVDLWGLLKNPEPVEFAKYIRDHFPSSSLEKEIDLPMFILGTFATSLCNINHPRHVPAKFTTSNLKIPQRDAWPTYWNYTLLGRYYIIELVMEPVEWDKGFGGDSCCLFFFNVSDSWWIVLCDEFNKSVFSTLLSVYEFSRKTIPTVVAEILHHLGWLKL